MAALAAVTLLAGNVYANSGDMNNVASTTAIKKDAAINDAVPPDIVNINTPAPNANVFTADIAVIKVETDVNQADDPGSANAPPNVGVNGNQIVANSFNPVATPPDVGKVAPNFGGNNGNTLDVNFGFGTMGGTMPVLATV